MHFRTDKIVVRRLYYTSAPARYTALHLLSLFLALFYSVVPDPHPSNNGSLTTLGTRCLTSLGVGGGYHDGLDSSVFALVEYVSLDGGDVVSGHRGFGFLAARETQA